MTRTIVFTLMMVFVGLPAVGKDKNPADYPLVAHVVSRGRGSSDFTVGEFVVRMRVGNVIYATRDMYCMANILVGSDVRAKVKGQFMHLLTAEGKTCMTSIEGVYEVK